MNDIANSPEAITAGESCKSAPPRSSEIELVSGDYALALLPRLGGAVARLTWRGRDVLRPTRADAIHSFESASFVLAPYANRIANGSFKFRGKEVRLESNFKPHPHPLHGQAWLAAWSVAQRAKNKARIVFLHDRPDEWPWKYSATQSLTLSEDGLRIDLGVTNLSKEAMPASYGFHPYFPRLSGSRFKTSAQGVWLVDDQFIPLRLSSGAHFLSLEEGVLLDQAPFVDHCHTGWRGAVTIDQPACGMTVEMRASRDLGFLHIYTPENAPYFCLEPVSAMPDAVNRPEPPSVTGLREIAPGETASAFMTLSARALDRTAE
ncbi:MAG: aldose 1-epimerase [Alphaproteobacteria bacterium]|nr:aldose 1-epimerase [Alphaproteobacteria bacterium]